MLRRQRRSLLLLGLGLFAALVLLGCGAPGKSGATADMQDVQSSALRSVGYDGGREVLVVTFVSGSTYEYTGVPRDVYEELMNAPSKGRYFNASIKGRFSYRRIH